MRAETTQKLADGRLYLRQWRSGRDFARNDDVAAAMANYAYGIGDRDAGEALLVDPGHAPLELVELLGADEMGCAGVVLTHYHADHAGGELSRYTIAGVAELVAHVPVPIHLNGADRDYLLSGSAVPPGALVAHGDGDRLATGALELTLVHTPGHTPGSQCIYTEDLLLTGDTLFLIGCGRTDGPGGDAVELYESLAHRLGVIPDRAVVYPGHAYDPEPHALLGEVRRRNPVLTPMALEEWVAHFSG